MAPLAKKVRDPALVRCFSAQSFPLTPARDNNDLLNSALRLSLLCFLSTLVIVILSLSQIAAEDL